MLFKSSFSRSLLFTIHQHIDESAPDSVKYPLAPTGYNLSHVHRSVVPGEPTRGVGLAIIAADGIVVRDHKLQTTRRPASFELQLVNFRVGNQVITIANIYRPPSNPKSMFLVELSNLLSSSCPQPGNRLLLCGDFNLPGQRDGLVDEDLLAVLVQFGMEQHVQEPTHYAVGTNRENVLDLVITLENSTLVSTTSIVTSHHLSDYRLIICDLNIGRHKMATLICMARNIKSIDRTDFERRLLHSLTFTNPAVTTVEFLPKSRGK